MPAIRRVTLYQVRVPIAMALVNCPEFAHEPLNRGPSGGFTDGEYFANVPFIVVKVESDAGPAGWGDTNRLQSFDALKTAAGKLLGQSPTSLRSDDPAWATIPKGLHSAALDWAARAQDKPLWELFGTKVRPGVTTASWSGHRTPAGAARLAKEAQAKGFNCLKLKANMEQDSAGIIAAVRDACGPQFHVVIDPNGRWETLEETLGRAKAMMAACPTSSQLEDPVYGEQALPVLTEINRQTGIFTIKTVTSTKMVEDAKAAGVNGLNLNGPWPTLHAMSQVAGRMGLPYWCGSAVESGLGDLATIHFGMTQPGFTLDCELAGHMTREHALIDKPIRYQAGRSIPPDGPGLGACGDMAAIEKYSVAEPVVVG